MATRILNKDLDERLRSVEEKLAEMAERMARLDEHLRQNQPVELVDEVLPAESHNGHSPKYEAPTEDGKMAELEAQLSRLDERIERIASTIIVQQASRFS